MNIKALWQRWFPPDIKLLASEMTMYADQDAQGVSIPVLVLDVEVSRRWLGGRIPDTLDARAHWTCGCAVLSVERWTVACEADGNLRVRLVGKMWCNQEQAEDWVRNVPCAEIIVNVNANGRELQRIWRAQPIVRHQPFETAMIEEREPPE